MKDLKFKNKKETNLKEQNANKLQFVLFCVKIVMLNSKKEIGENYENIICRKRWKPEKQQYQQHLHYM